MSDQAWIEQSLARLEQLEAQKAELEAVGDTETLAEVESEIRALYVALESVAEDGGDDEGGAEADPAVAAASFAPAASEGDESPFASPSPSPIYDVENESVDDAPLPFSTGVDASSAFDVDDGAEARTGGSKLPLVAGVAALVIAAVGVAYFVTSGGKKPAPIEAAVPGEAKVISASSVPDDTQEPDAARGAEATRTEGTHFRERPAAEPRRSSGTRTTTKKASSGKRSASEDDGRKIKSAKGDDPLDGI